MPYFPLGLDAKGVRKWRVRVQGGGRRRSRNVHGPEREAKRVERELIAELFGVIAGPLPLPTVKPYLVDRWLPHVALQREPATHARYRATVITHVIPRIGDIRLDRVGVADIQDVLDAMAAASRAPKTIHAARGVLHKAFEDAVRWEFVGRNPVRGTAVPTVEPASRRTLSRAEALLVIDAAQGLPIEPIVYVAMMSGARQGEVLARQWDDIDLDAGLMQVNGALKVVTGQPLRVGSTKEHKAHVIELSPSVVAVLRRHRAAQAEHRLRVGEAYVNRGFVFAHPDGRPIHPQTLRKWWRKLLAAAGIRPPWPRWHDLRHTNASALLDRGHGAPVVAERLGHASPDVTLKIYGHASSGAQRRAAIDLDAWLNGDVGARGPEMDLPRAQ